MLIGKQVPFFLQPHNAAFHSFTFISCSYLFGYVANYNFYHLLLIIISMVIGDVGFMHPVFVHMHRPKGKMLIIG